MRVERRKQNYKSHLRPDELKKETSIPRLGIWIGRKKDPDPDPDPYLNPDESNYINIIFLKFGSGSTNSEQTTLSHSSRSLRPTFIE